MTRYSYTLIDGRDGKTISTISSNLSYDKVFQYANEVKGSRFPLSRLFDTLKIIDPSLDILIPHTIVVSN